MILRVAGQGPGNPAGIEGTPGPIPEQATEKFTNVMNVNVLGVLNSMKNEIPAMRKSGGGAILNNASVASVVGMPGMSIYMASKHAVAGLTKVAALEWSAQDVRVNTVSPGAVRTAMYDRVVNGPEMEKQMGAMHPIGRVARPEEIARAVTFLCSDDASFITGVNLMTDGSFTAQ